MFKDPDIGKPAKQLREERQKRLNDAIDLKVPDRSSYKLSDGKFPGEICGNPLFSRIL